MLGVIGTAEVEVDLVAGREVSGGVIASSCFIIRGSNAQLSSRAESQVLMVDTMVRSSWVSTKVGTVTLVVGGWAMDRIPGCTWIGPCAVLKDGMVRLSISTALLRGAESAGVAMHHSRFKL